MFEEQTAQARVKEVRKAITGNEAHVALGEVVTPGTVSQSQLCLFCHRLPPIHVCWALFVLNLHPFLVCCKLDRLSKQECLRVKISCG